MDGTEQAPPTLLDRIRRRLELSYPWSHTDFRHDGTPVFTQMGNPVEDLKVVLQALDQTRLRLDALEAENDKLRGDRFSIERLRMEDAAEHMEHMAIWANAKRQLQAQLATTEAARAALEAEHQRLKAVDTPEPWADVFAASKRLVDSPSYAVGAFRALVARAYDWEVAAKARLQAQLTLAESSRASLEAERDTYRAACVAMHNGYVGAGNAGMHRADLIQEGIRLFDQVEATRGIGHADDVAEILSWRKQLETLLPPSSPSAQETL